MDQLTKPEQQNRSDRIMAPMDDAISIDKFAASSISKCKMDVDNIAADNGRKPLSWFQDRLNVNHQTNKISSKPLLPNSQQKLTNEVIENRGH